MIATDRLILRQWTEADRAPFAAMHADPEVMHDFPAPLTRMESDAKLDRYMRHIAELSFGKWAVERRDDGAFLGYVGVATIFPELPVYPGLEIGWRLTRAAWGAGYASEAARASLIDAFTKSDAPEVLSFAMASNARSVAVMHRLGLKRDAARDYVHPNGVSGPFVVYAAEGSKWRRRAF
ncbi:MAG TPA: GNAT family N-acetyltransferase [Caulobacteraceae bacterium]|nr:GNAT family N-acetyltransferase [Caulobacteraceae bacterium]